MPGFAWGGDGPFTFSTRTAGGEMVPISTPPMRPEEVVEILSKRGVAFGAGASASYDNDSFELVVTNRPAQLTEVDRIVRAMLGLRARRQLSMNVTPVDLTGGLREDVGFEWLKVPLAPPPDMGLSPEGGESNGFLNLGSGGF